MDFPDHIAGPPCRGLCAAVTAGKRSLNSLRTNHRLKIACRATLPTETYHTWINSKCGCVDIHSTGKTKLKSRLAELTTAGTVLPNP
jgi:hypothetical protein